MAVYSICKITFNKSSMAAIPLSWLIFETRSNIKRFCKWPSRLDSRAQGILVSWKKKPFAWIDDVIIFYKLHSWWTRYFIIIRSRNTITGLSFHYFNIVHCVEHCYPPVFFFISFRSFFPVYNTIKD